MKPMMAFLRMNQVTDSVFFLLDYLLADHPDALTELRENGIYPKNN